MNQTRVVILGGGFAGLYCARELHKTAGKDVQVTLVSEENFFLFTPMLHEVASSELGVTDIVSPMRSLLPRECRFFQGKVATIDMEGKTVDIVWSDEHGLKRSLEFDHLVIALGSETNSHHTPGVDELAHKMKTLADAIFLRNKLIANLERAEVDTDKATARRRLTVVVAGGGFAGVETVGAVNDMLRQASDAYPNISREHVRVMLVHSESRLLPELSEDLAAYTAEQLAKRDVEIVFNTRITSFDGMRAELSNGETIDTETVIWTAGVKPASFTSKELPTEKGALAADEFLHLRGYENVWVAGDCARISDTVSGGFYAPTAQNALREGQHIAKNIGACLHGKEVKPFKYSNKGEMASIGHHSAVARVMGQHIKGFPAWLMWRAFYWSQIPDLSHKLRVLFNWGLDLVFPPDYVRLATISPVKMTPETERSKEIHVLGATPEVGAKRRSA